MTTDVENDYYDDNRWWWRQQLQLILLNWWCGLSTRISKPGDINHIYCIDSLIIVVVPSVCLLYCRIVVDYLLYHRCIVIISVLLIVVSSSYCQSSLYCHRCCIVLSSFYRIQVAVLSWFLIWSLLSLYRCMSSLSLSLRTTTMDNDHSCQQQQLFPQQKEVTR